MVKIISVDTGNALIKTSNVAFSAGIVRHGNRPPAIKGDVIYYNGEYYSLTKVRAPYMYDKTQDNTYFVLTLFAIAKELLITESYKFGAAAENIVLAVGLPPTHLSALKARFGEYFRNNGKPINYEYNDKRFSITVDRVLVFPQGFSAINAYNDIIKKEPKAYIIDIGGYTTDVIMIVDGKPDMSFCESFDTFGVIHLYSLIERKLREQMNLTADEILIEAMLLRNSSSNAKAQEMARSTTVDYARQLINSLQEKGVELNLSLPVFIGGGAAIMQKIINDLPIRTPLFIPSVNANARGYAEMAALICGFR